MEIRKAQKKDTDGMLWLLQQVNMVHHVGRPDLFRIGTKYTKEQLETIIEDESRPILIAEDEQGGVAGYAFCIIQQKKDDNILTDIKTLYIDDLCVDESVRGKHLGRQLFDAAVALAKELACYNVTLNVWSCNEAAMRFYESCGLMPQKIGMEKIL